ncbi:MAG TPA: sensor histidine kinase [Micromonosporaceae bacterium]|jgi:signal transduction histidine kinase
MRTDRGWRRFYATGWLVSAGVTAVAFVMWQMHVREVERRAEEAERTRDEVARRRAVEERLRIARDLHDSLTHTISVIRVQAGVAAHLARKRGQDVPSALSAIDEASADAARELRATLDVLRRDDGGNGVAQLPLLVSRTRAIGLPTTVTVTGQPRALPPDVDVAAYRIVQEALTNISRHAGPATVSITLEYGLDALKITVDDDGNGAPHAPPSSGFGLVGMRERVDSLGGWMRAEPRDGGGFSVCAHIPSPAAS